MTVPDELVQAAADALMPGGYADDMTKEAARDALQAAFAKLPECEAAVEAASWAECPESGKPHAHHIECRDLARSHLNALAREFGGRDG